MSSTLVVFVPGFFGFGAFGRGRSRIEYFARVRGKLARHMPASTGFDHHEPPPTGSLASRVASLWTKLSASKADRIHLVGHSAGGLDARLLGNTAYTWPGAPSATARNELLSRIGTIVTVATPFHGTPIARRLGPFTERTMLCLYLLSILTSGADLRLGGRLLLTYMTTLKRLALGPSLNDVVIQRFLSHADASTADDIRRFLRSVVNDGQLVDDLRPDRMASLNATLGGSEFPRIRSFATVSPSPLGGLQIAPDPADAILRRALYALGYKATEPTAGEQRPFPRGPWVGDHPDRIETPEANDGVVPTGSQTLDGRADGIVFADHLDVIGHFEGKGGGGTFFKSGAQFDDARFTDLWQSVAAVL